MKQYLELLQKVLDEGSKKPDRTGVGTRSIFGAQMHFDISQDFPLLTTKSVHFKSVIHELLWFLKGETNVDYLNKNGISIWNEWANDQGYLGPVYGKQWRYWETNNKKIDQISNLIQQLKENPNSRRHVVSSWNVADLPKMALQPCHLLFQFYVNEGKLSCQLYQRSADIFLGVPFNISSYSLLTYMVAQVCDLKPEKFIWSGGDVHLYNNHTEQAKEQLVRKPKTLPTLKLNPEIQNIFDFKYEDIELLNYNPDPKISAPIAV